MSVRPIRSMLLILTALSLAQAACAGPAFEARSPVKLGLAVPLTGPEQAGGARILQAVRMAVARRNDVGGVAGRPVELVIQDDSGGPDGGMAAARRLAADPAVLAVVGHPDTGAAETAVPVYRDAQVAAALLGPVSEPRGPGEAAPWVLRLAPSPEEVARSAARFAFGTLRAATAVVVAGTDPEDAVQAETLRRAALAAGLRVLRSEALFPGTANYGDTLNRLADARPDVLLAAAGLPASAVFWRQAAPTVRAGVFAATPSGPFPEFAALAGPQASAAYLPAPSRAGRDRPDLDAFVHEYRAQWRTEPDAAALLAYDAASLMLEAMDGALTFAPSDARGAVRAELKGLRTFGGITGRVQFTEQGTLADPDVSFVAAIGP